MEWRSVKAILIELYILKDIKADAFVYSVALEDPDDVGLDGIIKSLRKDSKTSTRKLKKLLEITKLEVTKVMDSAKICKAKA